MRRLLVKSDPDAAIAWLRTIPSRFLPPTVLEVFGGESTTTLVFEDG